MFGKRNRVKGFTLFEMIVSMLVASILVILSWNVYFFLINYQKRVESKSLAVNNLRKMEYLLSRDLSRPFNISHSEGGFQVCTPSDTVSYLLTDSTITRIQKQEITFIEGFLEVLIKSGEERWKICLSQGSRIPSAYCFILSRKAASEFLVNSSQQEEL